VLIRDSVFLVTGAASGLGRAAATELLKRGGRVAAVDLNRPPAFAGTEANSIALRADVTDEDSVRKAVSRTVEHFGALQGCINCAGVITPQSGPDRHRTLERRDLSPASPVSPG
jgi:NAD(P)-dependent dehydrogenase (short-subunit alcohol dehydrogenase family)